MSGVVDPPLFVTNAGTSVVNYTPPAKVLVLGCIDPRFATYLNWFLTHYQDVYGKYDLFNLAGASLGVNQATTIGGPHAGPESGNYANVGNPALLHWHEVFYGHLGLALALHQITDVWIFDHLDCGAYKIIKFNDINHVDDDIDPHSTEIARLASKIDEYTTISSLTPLNVKGFVIDTSGNIYKVYDDERGGLSVTQTPSSNNIWFWPVVISAVVIVFIIFQLRTKRKL
jgi:hypothetical protein